MSHNVTLKGIQIKDFGLLEKALNELNKEFGTTFRLEVGENVESRNYNNDYFFRPGETSVKKSVLPGTVAVIHTEPMASYDITLTKNSDGTVSMQTESMMINVLIDKFQIDRKYTMNIGTGEACNLTPYSRDEQKGMQLALGKISQRYAVCLAERQAALAGHRTRREVEPKTGIINVIAAGM